MEASYRTRNGRMMVKIDAKTQKDLFRDLAQFQSVFEADESCGRCGSAQVNFEVRTVDANDYYSLRCLDCGAELSFGQHKQGSTLFPKRGENKGWRKWQAIEGHADH